MQVLCKGEDLTSDLQIHIKQHVGLAHEKLYPALVVVGAEIGSSLGLLATSLAKR